jgi:lipopolysaccharide/colanic/teichoic acid biosynthesis glycosyltransferase
VVSRPTNPIASRREGAQSPEPKQVVADILDESAFHRLIALERKRSERSQRPFVLLLIDTGQAISAKHGRVLLDIVYMLQAGTRETDMTGWYKTNSVAGVLFTETVSNNLVLSTILGRIGEILRKQLDTEQFGRIKFSFHVFPDDWDPENPDRPSNEMLYPDLARRANTKRAGHLLKRTIDVVGSMCLLILLSPIFAIAALAIKLTSRGPVLFMQKRIGEYGKPFTFFKFRSMYVDNDCTSHKEYVHRLIGGCAEKHATDKTEEGIFKLVNDPRITPVGRVLRRTSLDELPQLINVLVGDMSLVGPRPPVPYELEAYAIWHRRRLLEAKPGITGLWQVNGRSRVEFDDMVRLDLRYARECSPWLDLKILLQTPKAVIGGDGAC